MSPLIKNQSSIPLLVFLSSRDPLPSLVDPHLLQSMCTYRIGQGGRQVGEK